MLGFAVGAVLALMRLSHSRFQRTVAWGYVWAFRSIPLIVQISPLGAAVIDLTLHQAAYSAEIIRS